MGLAKPSTLQGLRAAAATSATTPGAEVAVRPDASLDARPGPVVPAGYGPLSVDEEEVFARAETALENLRLAFWAAGRALQDIRDKRLYRMTGYATFEAYCEGRWEMHRSYADKLIRAWPLAQVLSPIGLKQLNEGQVRELLPFAKKRGEEAAVIVYGAVCQAVAELPDGGRITAEMVRGAITALPPGRFDEREAVGLVREYVTRLANGSDRQGPSEEDKCRAKVNRVRSAADVAREAAKANPGVRAELISILSALLDELKREAAG